MIPAEKLAAVRLGLRAAFGVDEFDDLELMTKGQTSALVFRMVVQGEPYLLRIIMRADDPSRHYACMRAAAQAGVAPRVWYASVDNRISITDFVEAVPFTAGEALARMPAVLRALPPFERAPDHLNTTCLFLLNEGAALEGFLAKVRGVAGVPPDDVEALFAVYERVKAVYPRGSEMVASHNDLFKPDNVLFDGERVWLVDWEAAFLNDRYADLAVVANLIVANETEECAYLTAYFGAAPDAYQRARFFLMRQLTHIFYAMAFLYLGSLGGPVDWGEAVPSFGEYQRRFWAGEVRQEDGRSKVLYGRVHLNQVFENAWSGRFGEALRIVGEGLEADSLRE